MADVHRQGALEDDVLDAAGLRVDVAEGAEFGDETCAVRFGLREMSRPRLDEQRGRLVRSGPDADQRAAEDVRVLAKGRFK